jgi:hypothetical protein
MVVSSTKCANLLTKLLLADDNNDVRSDKETSV